MTFAAASRVDPGSTAFSSADQIDFQPSTPGAYFEEVRRFKGHSGCEVSLCRTGDAYFVRKKSASPQYSSRFLKQIEKQEKLSHYVKMPRIIGRGMINGLLFCDMEFVAGHDLSSYMPLQNVSSISSLVHVILDSLRLLSQSGEGMLPAREFLLKVDELNRSVRVSAFYPAHADAVDALLAMLSASSWNQIPQSECHGDLTMENMLITEDGTISFIDPLDGPLNSVWLDVAKLLQDLTSGWSLRTILWQNASSSETRLLQMLSRYLADEIQAQVEKLFPGIHAALPQLRILQAMRVLPYVQDAATFTNVVAGMVRIQGR